MCPIAHVCHWPCARSPMCPIPQGTSSLSLILTMIPFCPCVLLSMCPIGHVPHHTCAPSPMCPISQGAPSLSAVLIKIPLYPCGTLLMCQKVKNMWSYQKDVKKMSSCQKDVKCEKVKHMDYGGGSQKK